MRPTGRPIAANPARARQAAQAAARRRSHAGFGPHHPNATLAVREEGRQQVRPLPSTARAGVAVLYASGVVDYLDAVAGLIIAEVRDRPLSVIRVRWSAIKSLR